MLIGLTMPGRCVSGGHLTMPFAALTHDTAVDYTRLIDSLMNIARGGWTGPWHQIHVRLRALGEVLLTT